MINKIVLIILLCCALDLLETRAEPSGARATPVPVVVPPPVDSRPPLPRPPIQALARPLARPDVAEIQRLTPRVEIWRPAGQRPQVPSRHSAVNLDAAFVTGSEPVTLRLQFNPTAAGERVAVMAARGIILDPPEQVLTVSARGDCSIAAQLQPTAGSGHLIVRCRMIRTVVQIARAPLAIVQAEEERTGVRP